MFRFTAVDREANEIREQGGFAVGVHRSAGALDAQLAIEITRHRNVHAPAGGDTDVLSGFDPACASPASC